MRADDAILRYGFRPFFLGAGLTAALLIPWWAVSYAFGLPLITKWPPILWHGHEMLFGFIGAAIGHSGCTRSLSGQRLR